MSAIAAHATNPVEAAASPRPARRRPVPPSLPRALGRLAALAVATPVTVLTAQVVGAMALPLVETLTLVLASALLLVLVALGVRLRAILVTAVGTVVVAIPVVVAVFALLGASTDSRRSTTRFLIRVGLLTMEPGYLAAFFLLAAAAAGLSFAVLVYSISGGSRSLGRGLAVGVAASLAATAWLLLTILGFGFVAAAEPMALLWGALTIPVAWLASAAGQTMALRPGVALGVLRDTVFRTLALAAALTSAIWVGQVVEVQAGRTAIGTPLESLAVSAGWTVTVLLFTILAWTAWRMPRWLVVGQLRGRFEAVAVSETLIASALCCLVPLVVWRLAAGVVLGREWLVALAAAVSYGWIRLWFAAPAPEANVPLWVLVPNGTRGQVASLAATAAGAWRAGQVTILAAPEDAPRIGGEHLWAAGLAREIEALFPVRAVHLDDWVDAQPDAWLALPVRELYAPADLWPAVLGSRMEGTAVALVARGPEDPHPVTSFLERRPRTVSLLSRSSARTVRPGATAAEIMGLATSTIDQGQLRHMLRSLVAPSRPTRRFIVNFCTQESFATAERVARLIHAQLDAEGRTVDCHVVRRGATWWKPPWFQLGAWRLAALLLARSIGGAPNSLKRWLVAWLVAPMLGDDGATTLDVVVWEGAAQAAAPPVSIEAVDRFTAVRAAGAGPLDAAGVARAREAGEIRLARGDSTEAAAETVARKLLAYEVTPLSRLTEAPPAPTQEAPTSEPTPAMTPAAPEPAPATPPATSGRPVLFVSFSIIETTIYIQRPLLRGLRERLPGLEVIGSDSFVDFRDPNRRGRLESILAGAVAMLVMISRDGIRDDFMGQEVALGLERNVRIIPVLLDGARMPWSDELPPALAPLARWNAIELDALHGGPDALTGLIDRVARAMGTNPVAAPARTEASLRIYLFGHAADRDGHAGRLWYALRDRFGLDSTHMDTATLGPPDEPSGTPASPQSRLVALVPRFILRVILVLARVIAAVAPRSPQSGVATSARRFLLGVITALARRLPERSIALLAAADVVLVVMGPEFARIAQEGVAEGVDAFPLKTRLKAALDMRLRVLPVLMGGAVVPRPSAVPEELRRLTRLQAVEIREGSWNDDVDHLGDLIERLTERERGRPEPA